VFSSDLLLVKLSAELVSSNIDIATYCSK